MHVNANMLHSETSVQCILSCVPYRLHVRSTSDIVMKIMIYNSYNVIIILYCYLSSKAKAILLHHFTLTTRLAYDVIAIMAMSSNNIVAS